MCVGYVVLSLVSTVTLCVSFVGCSKNTGGGIAAVNGTTLSYEMKGDGRPLVLINDGILDRRLWDDQFSVFAEHYQVLRYDLRGWGASEIPTHPYSNVEDLSQLLTFLNIKKAFLLGSMVGGSVALDFALEHPERVAGLVLAGSWLGGFPYSAETLRWVHAWHAVAREGEVSRLLKMYLNNPFLGGSLKEHPTARDRIRKVLAENFQLYGIDLGRLLRWLDPPALQMLSSIRVPTLILVGERDSLDVRTIAGLLQARVQAAQTVVIADAAHLINIERPEEFNRTVLEFLNNQGPAS